MRPVREPVRMRMRMREAESQKEKRRRRRGTCSEEQQQHAYDCNKDRVPYNDHDELPEPDACQPELRYEGQGIRQRDAEPPRHRQGDFRCDTRVASVSVSFIVQILNSQPSRVVQLCALLCSPLSACLPQPASTPRQVWLSPLTNWKRKNTPATALTASTTATSFV